MLRPNQQAGKVDAVVRHRSSRAANVEGCSPLTQRNDAEHLGERNDLRVRVCLVLRGVRWARQKLMWRLRNRLIVTYVFIGVIPIILLVSMSLLAGYIFAGQFATYVALADLDSELQHLVTANNALASQFRTLTLQGKLTPQLAAEISSASGEGLSRRTVTVLEGDKGFQIDPMEDR